jgi:hypothetical protein
MVCLLSLNHGSTTSGFVKAAQAREGALALTQSRRAHH